MNSVTRTSFQFLLLVAALARSESAILRGSETAIAQQPSVDHQAYANSGIPEHRRRLFQESTCTLYRKCVTYQNNTHHDSWVCELNREDREVVGGYQFVDIVESESIHETIANATSGNTTLTISEAVLDEREPRMYVPEHANVHVHDGTVMEDRIRNNGETRSEIDRELVQPHMDNHIVEDRSSSSSNNGDDRPANRRSRRKLSTRTTGVLKTLVIRVIDRNGVQPTANTARMIDNVYTDDVSLKTQTHACSYGKTIIEPFSGPTPNGQVINNGVVDVQMDYDITGDASGMDQTALSAAKAQLGDLDDPMFDLVLFCIPPGKDDFLAFAYPNAKYSFYNDEWCNRVSTQMHEVGHNIGLAHSGEPGEGEYGDATGYMGGGSSTNENLQQCFNPQKNFQLGWYEDQVFSINPLDAQSRREYTLNGVVDYGRNQDNLLVLRMKQSSTNKDYYIGYNRATGMNADTGENPDQVTIVLKEYGAPDQYGQSTKVAALAPGQRVLIGEYDGSDRTIQVAFTGVRDGDARIQILEGSNAPPAPSPSCKSLTVEVVTDGYPGDNSWFISDTGGYGYIGGLSDPFTQPDTEYRQEVCLPRGRNDKTYQFNFRDNYGDGMHGNAGYRVFNSNGQLMFDGGKQFSADQKWNYHYIEVSGDPSIPATSPPTRAPTTAPTPTPSCREYLVQVKTDRYPEDTSWKFIRQNAIGDDVVDGVSTAYTAQSTTSTVEICLNVGTNYDFEFYDSYTDGLCCGNNDGDRGFYKVTDKCTGDVLVNSNFVDEKFSEKTYSIDVPNSSSCGGDESEDDSSTGNGKNCKNQTKRKFKSKPNGRKQSCKKYAKIKKCKKVIEGGKYDKQKIEEVCAKSCKACDD